MLKYKHFSNPTSCTMTLGQLSLQLKLLLESSWGKGQLVCKADNLTTISEATVHKMCDVSQPYGPPQPVTGIALPFYMYMFVPHRKHRPPSSATGIALHFYM
jgi:hypothetical protein